MTQALGLRGRGRPKGMKNKPKPPAAPLKNSRMLSLMEGCYTAEEWLKRFQKLSPSEQFRLKASVEPKAREEPPGTFCLIVNGLGSKLGKQYCPRCNWTSDDGFDFNKEKGGSL